MKGSEQRALLARLLRESVLKLCRNTMASHSRLCVDGIVLISLDGRVDDGDDGISDSECSTPIVVRIHEQLPKNRKRRKLDAASLLQHVSMSCKMDVSDVSTFCDMVSETSVEFQNGKTIVAQQDDEVKPKVAKEVVKDKETLPMDRKRQLLRRAFQAGLVTASDDKHTAYTTSRRSSSTSNGLDLAAPKALSSHHVHQQPSKLAGVEETEEEKSGRSPALDGHWSDPTPELCRKRKRNSSFFADHSRSHSELPTNASVTSRNGFVDNARTCHSTVLISSEDEDQPRSLSSSGNVSLSVTSSKHRSMKTASRRKSANCFHHPSASHRQRPTVKRLSLSQAVSSSSPSALLQRQKSFPFKSSQLLKCGQCPAEMLDALSLERHNQQQHGLFTCHQCLVTFTDRTLLSRHIRETHPLIDNGPSCLRSASSLRSFLHRSDSVVEAVNSPQTQPQDLSMKSKKKSCADIRMTEKTTEEEGEERSGPRQSWCTECHVGFPDESILIKHITSTHEVTRKHTLSLTRARPHEHQNHKKFHAEAYFEEAEKDKDADCMQVGGMSLRERNGGDADRLESGERTEEEEDEGMPQGLPLRHDTALRLDDDNRSLSGVRSPSSGLYSSYGLLRRPRECSPLRVVPLPSVMEKSLRGAPSPNPKSLMTLVKPKDLVINATPSPPAARFSSPEMSQEREWTVVDEVVLARRSRHVDNFLEVDRSSLSPGSSVETRSPPAPCPQGLPTILLDVKEEPSDDSDYNKGFAYRHGYDRQTYPQYVPRRYPFPALDYIVSPRPREAQDVPPEGRSPDLPTDLSLRRSRSSSPRPLAGDVVRGTSHRKSPSFEKAPDIPFRNQRPLSCSHSECGGQQFSSFQELEEHSAKLHRRFLCEYCGKGFTAKPNRDRHVRYHTGVTPYKCSLCPMAFHRGDDLKYHRTTKHSRDPSIH